MSGAATPSIIQVSKRARHADECERQADRGDDGQGQRRGLRPAGAPAEPGDGRARTGERRGAARGSAASAASAFIDTPPSAPVSAAHVITSAGAALRSCRWAATCRPAARGRRPAQSAAAPDSTGRTSASAERPTSAKTTPGPAERGSVRREGDRDEAAAPAPARATSGTGKQALLQDSRRGRRWPTARARCHEVRGRSGRHEYEHRDAQNRRQQGGCGTSERRVGHHDAVKRADRDPGQAQEANPIGTRARRKSPRGERQRPACGDREESRRAERPARRPGHEERDGPQAAGTRLPGARRRDRRRARHARPTASNPMGASSATRGPARDRPEARRVDGRWPRRGGSARPSARPRGAGRRSGAPRWRPSARRGRAPRARRGFP